MSSPYRAGPAKPQLRPGVVLTLWHGDGLDDATDAATLDLLAQARPDVVQLHAAPKGLTAHARAAALKVRGALPGVRRWLGVGCDGWLWEWAQGRCSRQAAVDRLTGAADLAAELGAEAVCWNGEAAYKEHVAQGAELARVVLERTASVHPPLAQAFTSYDHPHYHPDPWRSWCYPGSPVTAALPQVYAAPGGDVLPYRGALPARERTAMASWQTAVRKGWVGPDVHAGAPGDEADLDWYPYVQAHSVLSRDTIPLALRYSLTSWWAAPTRLDAEGRLALLVVCELRRQGYTGPDAVQQYQREHGLASDGVVGPLTLAKLESQRKGVAPT